MRERSPRLTFHSSRFTNGAHTSSNAGGYLTVPLTPASAPGTRSSAMNASSVSRLSMRRGKLLFLGRAGQRAGRDAFAGDGDLDLVEVAPAAEARILHT